MAQSVKCLPSAHVMILGSWYLAPQSAESGPLLNEKSASSSPSAPPPAYSLSLSQMGFILLHSKNRIAFREGKITGSP